MKSIDRIRHGINFKVVWFADEPVKESGIITYHQATFEHKDAIPFTTLINDISEDAEEIKSHFSKSCKYKVNRATREDISIEIKDSSEITDDDIEAFLDFFDKFWESKGSKLSDYDSVKRDINDYRAANALSMGIGKVAGEVAIYHTHICDDERARLLHSASLYRTQDDEAGNTKNLIGMANRYLHYQEMIHFKECGKNIYDWGGAGKGDDVINITEFKESFGGKEVTYYDFEDVRGVKSKIFKLLVAIMDDILA